MKKLTRLILAGFLTCFPFTVGYAQTPTALRPGTPIERELSKGQVHSFTVDLEENSVMQLLVEQKGIDVVVSVSSSKGKCLNDYDTPNGPNGPEHISFVALAAGTYSINVEPLATGTASKGRYEIKVIELRRATDEELSTRKNLELARTKAFELLQDLEGLITQIKTPESRIRARVQAANLLWDDHEKRAAKYLTDATADLKELIASADADDPEYQQKYYAIWQIRHDMVQLLSEADPEAALALLYSTVPPRGGWEHNEQIAQESGLELSVASKVIERNPQRAFEIARRTLKQSYPTELVRIVQELQAKDPKLASQLMNEILDKLLNEKLGQNTQATQLVISLFSLNRVEGNSSSTSGSHPLTSNVIPLDKSKQLLQKALDEVLPLKLRGSNSYQFSPSLWALLHSFKSMGAELDKILSGSSSAIDKKYKQLTGRDNIVDEPQSFIGTVDEVLQSIEKAPSEDREQMYLSLVQRESGKGETLRARQIINDYVKSPVQRNQWLYQLEQQEITHAIANGKHEEALRLIGALRFPSSRAGYLAQLAATIGPGHNRSSALSILDQARASLPATPQAQNAEQLHALIEIARAFGRYDSKRAFEILDPLIDQFNENCAAARTLNGFLDGEFYKNDELARNGNPISETAHQMSSVLGELALANFDLAKTSSDRFRLTEVRLTAYLEIAAQAIQSRK